MINDVILVRPKAGLSHEDAGKFLRVKEWVIAAVLDPGAIVDAHNVGVGVAGEGEAGERQEPVGKTIILQFIWQRLYIWTILTYFY